jgi:glutathione synthase/RimK-type ligase-like ATP-grasp enzyme
MDRVLIVAPADDIHALSVKWRLERRQQQRELEVILFDLATFPSRSSVTFQIGEQVAPAYTFDLSPALPLIYSINALYLPSESIPLSSKEVRSVWWRRPRLPAPDPQNPELLATYIKKNFEHCIFPFFANSSVFTINPIRSDGESDFKIEQLQVAAKIGLTIPATLVTSDPLAAERFINMHASAGREVIYKELSRTRSHGVPTCRFKKGDVARLSTLRHCPTIFQELITGIDVRVVVLGDIIVAAAQISKLQANTTDSQYVDIREIDPDNIALSVIEVPPHVKDLVIRFLNKLGTPFGVLDFILVDDKWFFLENNPQGQWLFIELACGFPIADMLADSLINCSYPTKLDGHIAYTEDELLGLAGGNLERDAIERALKTSPVFSQSFLEH